MSVKFFVWAIHSQTGRRIKEACETWPTPFCEPIDAAAEFARDYAARWSEDPDFPNYPCRDKNGQIVLPAGLDVPPADYIAANTEPAPAPEPAVRYPFSGPANIVRGPATSGGTIAAYEKSRRGLRALVAKPPPAPYEAPTSRVSSHTPSTPPQPPIAPRYYANKDHPKYSRPGGHRA